MKFKTGRMRKPLPGFQTFSVNYEKVETEGGCFEIWAATPDPDTPGLFLTAPLDTSISHEEIDSLWEDLP